MDLTDAQVAGLYGLIGAFIGGAITLWGNRIANKHAAKMEKDSRAHQDRLDLISRSAAFLAACRSLLVDYDAGLSPRLN